MASSSNGIRIHICHGGGWNLVNKRWEYGPVEDCSRRAGVVHVEMTYRSLVEYVFKKLGLKCGGVKLSYEDSVDGFHLDIVEDEDVVSFISFAKKSKKHPAILYVVESTVGNFDNMNFDVHEDTNIVGDTYKEANKPYEMHEDIEGVRDTYANSPGEWLEADVHVPEQDDLQYPNVFNEDDFNDVKAEANPEYNFEEKPSCGIRKFQSGGINDFFGMPPLIPDVVVTYKTQENVPYVRSSTVRVGDYFDTKNEMLIALGMKAVSENRQYKTLKSDTLRFRARCVGDNCSWLIYAKSVTGTACFVIRKFVDVHTCSGSQIHGRGHRQATPKVLGTLLRDAFEDPGRDYRPKQVVQDVKSMYSTVINYRQAWAAKCYAIKLLRGSPEDSFRRLPAYCYNLKQWNPGSVTHIRTDNVDRFEMFFIALGCGIRGFLKTLRPLVILDGAHLKGRYLGTMFVAVGMDGNNQIYPLAFGVGKSESGDGWSWFLEKLKGCIGEPEGLVFISDRHASIRLAIEVVFPSSVQALCCRHIVMNLRKRDNRIEPLDPRFWKMCKAYTESEFYHKLSMFRLSINANAREALDGIDPTRWARALFPQMRYNVMTSNSAESINALTSHSRRLPIVALTEFYRAFQQQWYHQRRNYADGLKHAITPWAEHKIEKRTRKSSHWNATAISNSIYEVKEDRKRHLVYLDECRCTCRQWQISGIPCGHVIVVANFMKLDSIVQFISPFYRTDLYRQTYVEPIMPVPDPSEWLVPDNLQIVEPPELGPPKVGRPSKNDRIKSVGEVIPSQKKCSNCHAVGHNRRNCQHASPEEGCGASQYHSTIDLNMP